MRSCFDISVKNFRDFLRDAHPKGWDVLFISTTEQTCKTSLRPGLRSHPVLSCAKVTLIVSAE
jgi:lysylphosphatidylglycerol synthetase-like protein (DUF2156 family)